MQPGTPRRHSITFEYQHYLPFRGCGMPARQTGARLRGLCPARHIRGAYVPARQVARSSSIKAYDPSCGTCPLGALRQWPLSTVRLAAATSCWCCGYNPDAFKIAGMTRRTTKKERRAQLQVRLLGELPWRASSEAPFTRLAVLFYAPGRGEQRTLP